MVLEFLLEEAQVLSQEFLVIIPALFTFFVFRTFHDNDFNSIGLKDLILIFTLFISFEFLRINFGDFLSTWIGSALFYILLPAATGFIMDLVFRYYVSYPLRWHKDIIVPTISDDFGEKVAHYDLGDTSRWKEKLRELRPINYKDAPYTKVSFADDRTSKGFLLGSSDQDIELLTYEEFSEEIGGSEVQSSNLKKCITIIDKEKMDELSIYPNIVLKDLIEF